MQPRTRSPFQVETSYPTFHFPWAGMPRFFPLASVSITTTMLHNAKPQNQEHKAINVYFCCGLWISWAVRLLGAPRWGGLSPTPSCTCSPLTRVGLALLRSQQAEFQEHEQSAWLLEAWAQNCHLVTSATFFWLKQTIWPVQIPSKDKQTPSHAGGWGWVFESHCWGCKYWEGKNWGQFCN